MLGVVCTLLTLTFKRASRQRTHRAGRVISARKPAMNRQVSALVVNSDAGMLRLLQAVLQDQRITTRCARTCEEARAAVSGGEAPVVIFAGTSFSDGTWQDVLVMAE